MNKFFSILLVLFSLLIVLSVSALGADNHTDEGQELQEPELKDILYLPAFPDEFYNSNQNYYVVVRNNTSGVYYLFISNVHLWHMSYYDSLYVYTPNYPDFKAGCYSFHNNISPKKWNLQQTQTYLNFSLSGYSIVSSNYVITNGYFHEGENGIYYTPYEDFYAVTFALVQLQYRIKNTLGVLLPIGILILSSFILYKLITRYLKPYAKPKSYRRKVKKVGLNRFEKQYFKKNNSR